MTRKSMARKNKRKNSSCSESDSEPNMKKRKQEETQCSHANPVPSNVLVSTTRHDNNVPEPSTCDLTPTKPSETVPSEKLSFPCQPGISKFRFQHYFHSPLKNKSPLPEFEWADSRDVWNLMLKKEQLYEKDPSSLDRHAGLHARMRSILLDWLIEVCEVYRLHRETFYLAVDFIDRYLRLAPEVMKQQLQLVGVTSLFVAAKIEEIYPPKISEFAYVTDGACTEDEITMQELLMLKVLRWDLSPMTCNSWLSLFLQLLNTDPDECEMPFESAQFSQSIFISIMRILDLCVLDNDSLQFSNSVLTTAAIYHVSSENLALRVSGYNWEDIESCVDWMSSVVYTLREADDLEVPTFTHIQQNDAHNIQVHGVNIELLEKAQARRRQIVSATQASPDLTQKSVACHMTPPQSKEKGKETYE